MQCPYCLKEIKSEEEKARGYYSGTYECIKIHNKTKETKKLSFSKKRKKKKI